MSEPMVRIVHAICERHGNRGTVPIGESNPLPITRLRAGCACDECHIENHPLPHPVRIATEPVDLEPREEQAG